MEVAGIVNGSSEGSRPRLVISAPRDAARHDHYVAVDAKEYEILKVFCGIDWAEGHHDIALIDEAGQLAAKKRIRDDALGFTALLELLKIGDHLGGQTPVAIETPRGLLVAALRATGRPVFAINPMAVARYRERHSVSRTKFDHADAMTLANILRHRPSRPPPAAP